MKLSISLAINTEGSTFPVRFGLSTRQIIITSRILRKFISVENLIDPGKLAKIKIQTNKLEQKLAKTLALPLPRPVNLDPGIIEPSKLILATTKNYSHRIYIGKKMYAEVTLIYDKGHWRTFEYTYPDYKQQSYFDFFSKIRERLLEQIKIDLLRKSQKDLKL